MSMQSDQPAGVLGGVYVANVTPFRDDDRYSVDVDSYLAHVRWLAGHGVTGVIPFGTNGEGPSVTVPEKRAVLDALIPEAGSLQVVPTVAEGNLPDTLDQLAYLDDLPVRAVLVLPPYFFKPVDIEGLRLFYERVLKATRHPVVVYHIPKYAIPVPAELVTSLPVWGAKDSGGDAGYTETVRAAGKGILVGHRGRPACPPADRRRLDLRSGEHRSRAGGGAVRPRPGRPCEEAAHLSAHLQRVRAMTKEYVSAGVLKRVAEQRHGHPMGTVRPPLAPVPASFDAAAATERAVAGPADAGG